MVGKVTKTFNARSGGNSFQMMPILVSTSTCMALNGNCVNITHCFFVIPFLIPGLPYFMFATLPTSKWLVDIILGQRSVGINMVEFTHICRHSRWVSFPLEWVKAQYPLSFEQLFGAGVSPCVQLLSHEVFILKLCINGRQMQKVQAVPFRVPG